MSFEIIWRNIQSYIKITIISITFLVSVVVLERNLRTIMYY
jgi:hypothetical protein